MRSEKYGNQETGDTQRTKEDRRNMKKQGEKEQC